MDVRVVGEELYVDVRGVREELYGNAKEVGGDLGSGVRIRMTWAHCWQLGQRT